MLNNSYGPSQPEGEAPRNRCARSRCRDKLPKEAARLNNETNAHARARRISGRRKKKPVEGHGWGGTRNRRDRETTALKQEHAEGILRAIAVAELKGMPLNRFWTVNYEWAGIEDSNGTAFIGKLLAQCARFARAKGGAFAAVWVREIGAINGAHVHIALHLPCGWKLSGHHPRKWIKAAGGSYSGKVSDMRPIGSRLDCITTNPGHYWANAEAMGSYMVKGSAEPVANELGLSLRKDGGCVIGKRWGRTQNLRMG